MTSGTHGEIVGAAIVAHVPPIVMDEAYRRSTNHGEDISLVGGLHRLRAERIAPLGADTLVVLDTHWFTTFEHVVSAHDHRSGRFTSSELPRAMAGVPFDYPGDPVLATAMAEVAAERDDTWVHPSADPYLPVYYATINLLPFVRGDERVVSVSTCQTATTEDFLILGEVLAEAVARSGRRVVLLGSGGLSHRFWPLRELRSHEDVDPENVVTPEARAADEQLLGRLEAGDHAAVVSDMPSYLRHAPEGRFGHYLTLVGAIGGPACRASAARYSNYEASAGTGQIHLWFERPAGGWSA